MINDFEAGKAGEHLVCADLITKGYIAFLSDQGLPYDVLMECIFKGRLLKIQVKATRGLRNVPQRKNPVNCYIFNIKRRGKWNAQRTNSNTCDLFALVALDTKEIGYLANQNVKVTMNFRSRSMKYRAAGGTYLTDLTLEKALWELK